MVALNRTYALYKARGRAEAIPEAEKLGLWGNHYFCTLMGELFAGEDPQRARGYYARALDLAKTDADKNVIAAKMARLAS